MVSGIILIAKKSAYQHAVPLAARKMWRPIFSVRSECPAAANGERNDEHKADQVLKQDDDRGRCEFSRRLSQSAHRRDTKERQRGESCAQGQILGFVTYACVGHLRVFQMQSGIAAR
ncbi:MAG: hypothetical protein WAM06_00970 [Methyloceanibacter sp.]